MLNERAMPSRKLSIARVCVAFLGLAVVGAGCKKSEAPTSPAGAAKTRVGLVTDVGGRGDGSFNDAALRGLELWTAGVEYRAGGYAAATETVRKASFPDDLLENGSAPPTLAVEPLVLQSRSQEDYEPQLELLVQRQTQLSIGVGFMLENAVEAAAKANPEAKFLLIDSPLLDASGKPFELPNVTSVIYREEEGSFLAGALAGLVTKTGKIGFVGGMELPLIHKFEVGFRAGVMATNPQAAKSLLVTYTGSFDKVPAGKQVAEDFFSKGVDLVFHAAGAEGLGVIQAAKEQRAGGGKAFVIGVDSDQSSLAPEIVLTSMVKRVDLTVYEAAKDAVAGRFTSQHRSLGLADKAVALAPIRVELPDREKTLAKVEGLKKDIIAGTIRVPSTREGLAAFQPPASAAQVAH